MIGKVKGWDRMEQNKVDVAASFSPTGSGLSDFYRAKIYNKHIAPRAEQWQAPLLSIRRKILPGLLVEAHPPAGMASRLCFHSDIVGYHIPKARQVMFAANTLKANRQSKERVR
jgi:hypothetical protein